MVRTSNMAELVPSGMVFAVDRTQISLRKTPVFISIQLRAINNCLRATFSKNQAKSQYRGSS